MHASSVKHGMAAVRSRVLNYLANNWYSQLLVGKVVPDVEEDLETVRLALQRAEQPDGEPCQMRMEDPFKPKPVITMEKVSVRSMGLLPNRPKPPAKTDEATFERQLAEEVRERVRQEQDLRKAYPQLEYPPVPESEFRVMFFDHLLLVGFDEAERRLMALLLVCWNTDVPENEVDELSEAEEEQETPQVEDVVKKSSSATASSFTVSVPCPRTTELLYKRVDQTLPRIPGVGRQMAAKHRAAFRARIDCSSLSTMPLQRRRLEQRQLADRLKVDELTRKKCKAKKSGMAANSARRGRGAGGKKSVNVSSLSLVHCFSRLFRIRPWPRLRSWASTKRAGARPARRCMPVARS